MSSGSACWILWLTPMDWLALSIGRSGSQPLEYSVKRLKQTIMMHDAITYDIELLLETSNNCNDSLININVHSDVAIIKWNNIVKTIIKLFLISKLKNMKLAVMKKVNNLTKIVCS